MIEAINTATASAQAATQTATQATANTSMQSHAQPFAPAQASPAQAKEFGQHMSRKSADAAAPAPQTTAAVEADTSPSPVRERISQVSKRIESGMAQYERLEGDLQMAADSNDLPKSLRIVGQMAKDTALGHAYMNFGITTTGASVGVFQNLMRVSEK